MKYYFEVRQDMEKNSVLFKREGDTYSIFVLVEKKDDVYSTCNICKHSLKNFSYLKLYRRPSYFYKNKLSFLAFHPACVPKLYQLYQRILIIKKLEK